MINHISIKNFAIIENADVDFEDGLNIITGETGSGKSILIEAISLALGSRADTTAIRSGCDKAQVTLLGELDGEEILISREVSSSGKNLCRLNGEIVTLSQLNEVCRRLADIHGQYDNQSLLNPDYHLVLLDTYRSDQLIPAREAVKDCFTRFSQCKTKFASLISTEKENLRKKDFCMYEASEIDNARLSPGEDEELEERISLLQNSEKIFENIEKSYALINDASPSLLDGLGSCMRAIESISSCSAGLESLSREISDLYYRLQDVSHNLRDFKEETVFSPAELDASIARLNLIDNLKKKYGSSIDEILSYREKLASQLNIMENYDDMKAQLEKDLIGLKKELLEKCSVLSRLRREAALSLEEKIQKELTDLNFGDACIKISVTDLSAPSEEGIDKVEILISTNRGEPLKPLYKIVSGGEMSRIMLAFKNVISSYDMIPTLFFDEIDNGISGVTASIVGRKLREIARNRQIICITHLPQIAACGDYNYRIFKQTDGEKTFTSVEKLNSEETVHEIARLLGGTNITGTTLRSAEELIENCIN